MAIRPVASVSFSNQYNNVNFEGRKNKETHSHSSVTNTLKSIPLAVAIAMSPMVTQAQTPREKELQCLTVDTKSISPSTNNKSCEIRFISTDGNDNDFEITRLANSVRYKGRVKGYKDPVECVYTYTTDVKTLEVCNMKNHEGTEHWKQYYAVGPGTVTRSRVKTPDGEWTGQVQKRNVSENRTEISKEMYDYLKELLENEVEYKTTSGVGSEGTIINWL